MKMAPQPGEDQGELPLDEIRIKLEVEQRHRGILVACAAGAFTGANIFAGAIFYFFRRSWTEAQHILNSLIDALRYPINPFDPKPEGEVLNLLLAVPLLFTLFFAIIIIYCTTRALLSGFARHVSARNYSDTEDNTSDIYEWIKRGHEQEKKAVNSMLYYMQFMFASLPCAIFSGTVFVAAFTLRSEIKLQQISTILPLFFPPEIVIYILQAWFIIAFLLIVFILFAWRISAFAINDHNRKPNRNIRRLATGTGMLTVTWFLIVVFSSKTLVPLINGLQNVFFLLLIVFLMIMSTFLITLWCFIAENAGQLVRKRNRDILLAIAPELLAATGTLIGVFSSIGPLGELRHMSWPFASVLAVIVFVALTKIISSFLILSHFIVDRAKKFKIISRIKKNISS